MSNAQNDSSQVTIRPGRIEQRTLVRSTDGCTLLDLDYLVENTVSVMRSADGQTVQLWTKDLKVWNLQGSEYEAFRAKAAHLVEPQDGEFFAPPTETPILNTPAFGNVLSSSTVGFQFDTLNIEPTEQSKLACRFTSKDGNAVYLTVSPENARRIAAAIHNALERGNAYAAIKRAETPAKGEQHGEALPL
jgi:hypothetical protein